MPEKELWPAGSGSAPGTQDGRCDSMTGSASTRSGSSESSYDFLSAEEKACLLFLEETIGSLDTEVDSGPPTDESQQATSPGAPVALPTTQPASQGSPEEGAPPLGPEKREGPEPHSVTQPGPLQGRALRPSSHSLPRNIHIGRHHSPRDSAPQAVGRPPGTPEQEQRAGDPAAEAAPGAGAVLIPPPEGFRDSQLELSSGSRLPPGPGLQLSGQRSREAPGETMAQRATSAESSQDRAHEAGAQAGADSETQLPPVTAPKPRKLPPNIVLKSSRGSLHGDPHTWPARPSGTAPGDSGLAPSSLEVQRRARREALEKLGLPQDQQEPGAHLSKPRRPRDPRAPGPALPTALAQPTPSTLAPAGPQGPPPGKASSAQGSVPGKAWTPAQDPAAGKASVAASMPVPIPKSLGARSAPAPPKLDWELGLQDSGIPGLRQTSFKSNTLERSGVGLSSLLAAEKEPGPQTSSSLGKDSFLHKASPAAQRHCRPRPASLGTRKDFAGIQVGKLAELEQEQSAKRPAYPGQSHDKLPRPACVSVKISPKGVPDEHRREALRKLGLLKE